MCKRFENMKFSVLNFCLKIVNLVYAQNLEKACDHNYTI